VWPPLPGSSTSTIGQPRRPATFFYKVPKNLYQTSLVAQARLRTRLRESRERNPSHINANLIAGEQERSSSNRRYDHDRFDEIYDNSGIRKRTFSGSNKLICTERFRFRLRCCSQRGPLLLTVPISVGIENHGSEPATSCWTSHCGRPKERRSVATPPSCINDRRIPTAGRFSFVQKGELIIGGENISPARAKAVHDCRVRAEKYSVGGNFQLYTRSGRTAGDA
jgi:hypothetical protein